MLITDFQIIIFYQWTIVATYSLKTTSIHIIPVWPGSAVWNLRKSLDINHWTKDLCGRWNRVGDLENADLDPGIKASGSQKLLVQLVLPTACTRGCFEPSNTYLPDQAKAIGLRIINMRVNFLVFRCYFLWFYSSGKIQNTYFEEAVMNVYVIWWFYKALKDKSIRGDLLSSS